MAQDIQQYIPGLYSNSPITISAKHIAGSGGATRTIAPISSGFAADYSTDGVADNIEIQAAIDTVSALGGGTIFLRAGTYNITINTLIVMRSNITLLGEGEASIVALTTGSYFVNSTISNGPIIASNNFKFLNFTINCSAQGAQGANEYGIVPVSTDNVEIAGMHIINASGFAVFVLSDPTSVGGATGDLSHISIHHNYMTGRCLQDIIGGGPNTDTPDTLFRDLIIESNFLVHDKGLAGSGTHYNAIDIAGVNLSRFTGNFCEGTVYCGNEREPNQFSIINGNVIRPPHNTTTVMSGIVIQDENGTGATASGKLLVSGNLVYGGHIRAEGKSGKKINNVSIVGNIVINNPNFTTNDQTNKLSQNGLILRQASRCILEGNYCYGPSVTNDGIILDNTDNCAVSNNYLDGYANSLTEANTVTTSFWTNNFSINSSTAPTSSIVQNAPNNYGLNPNKLFAQGTITGTATMTRVNGDVITATLSGDTTLTLTNGQVKGDKLILDLTTASHVVTLPSSNLKIAGGTYTMSSGRNILSLYWDGTNWIEYARAVAVA